jgi:hypothetical protein
MCPLVVGLTVGVTADENDFVGVALLGSSTNNPISVGVDLKRIHWFSPGFLVKGAGLRGHRTILPKFFKVNLVMKKYGFSRIVMYVLSGARHGEQYFVL